MGHEKSRNRTTRFRQADDDALDAVAAALRMERSDAIRFCIHEKARALGLLLPPRPLEPVSAEAVAIAKASAPKARKRR